MHDEYITLDSIRDEYFFSFIFYTNIYVNHPTLSEIIVQQSFDKVFSSRKIPFDKLSVLSLIKQACKKQAKLDRNGTKARYPKRDFCKLNQSQKAVLIHSINGMSIKRISRITGYRKAFIPELKEQTDAAIKGNCKLMATIR